MNFNPSLEYVWTQDDLKLQGIHYHPQEEKDLGVLFIHGMSGNFIENAYADVMGKMLAKEGIGYIYAHNRGYSHINDITTREKAENGFPKTKRIGATYERFEHSLFDIEAWLQKTKDLGYKRIILAGHSLGAPKVVYFHHHAKPENIEGVILMSPGDMVGLVKKEEYQPNYKKLLKEAKELVDQGKPRALLSAQVWDWYTLSAQTFLDLFESGGPADILPLYENPHEWPELAGIQTHILCLMGEHDDVAINTLEKDMQMLEKKAVNARSFTNKMIPGADHNYQGKEHELSEMIIDWIRAHIL